MATEETGTEVSSQESVRAHAVLLMCFSLGVELRTLLEAAAHGMRLDDRGSCHERGRYCSL